MGRVLQCGRRHHHTVVLLSQHYTQHYTLQKEQVVDHQVLKNRRLKELQVGSSWIKWDGSVHSSTQGMIVRVSMYPTLLGTALGTPLGMLVDIPQGSSVGISLGTLLGTLQGISVGTSEVLRGTREIQDTTSSSTLHKVQYSDSY